MLAIVVAVVVLVLGIQVIRFILGVSAGLRDGSSKLPAPHPKGSTKPMAALGEIPPAFADDGLHFAGGASQSCKMCNGTGRRRCGQCGGFAYITVSLPPKVVTKTRFVSQPPQSVYVGGRLQMQHRPPKLEPHTAFEPQPPQRRPCMSCTGGWVSCSHESGNRQRRGTSRD